MTESPHVGDSRLPAFAPVPVKRRTDGWTPLRQAEFIGRLAETGSVSAAAARVGMARETAYRLRSKPGAEEFARAWDAALAVAGRPATRSVRTEVADERATLSPVKVTDLGLVKHLLAGRLRPFLRRGKFAGCVREAQNSALLQVVRQAARRPRPALEALRGGESFAAAIPVKCRPGGPAHGGPSASGLAVE